jgi:stage II sporulation protein D
MAGKKKTPQQPAEEAKTNPEMPVEQPAAETKALPETVGTAPAEEYRYNRSLKYGAEGEDVKALQTALAAAGCDVSASGEYDMKTVQAVQKRQRELGLPANGIIGKNEYSLLIAHK